MIENVWGETQTSLRRGGLHAVDAMARRASSLPWFSRIAQPPNASVLRAVERLGEVYGSGPYRVALVTSWNQARRLGAQVLPDFVGRAEEETEIAELRTLVAHAHQASLVSAIIDEATQRAEDAATGAAADAAMRSGAVEGSLYRLAGQAAARAFRAACLARVAGAFDHPAVKRLDLYAIGHWPLGIAVASRQVYLF